MYRYAYICRQDIHKNDFPFTAIVLLLQGGSLLIIKDGFMIGTEPGIANVWGVAASELRSEIPTYSGVYVHLVRPPGSSNWIVAYVGEAANLKDRIASDYINSNGTFGEISAPARCWQYWLAQAHGFSIQVRYRKQARKCNVAAKCGGDQLCHKCKELQLLSRIDFPNNDANNTTGRAGTGSGYRDIMIPLPDSDPIPLLNWTAMQSSTRTDATLAIAGECIYFLMHLCSALIDAMHAYHCLPLLSNQTRHP